MKLGTSNCANYSTRNPKHSAKYVCHTSAIDFGQFRLRPAFFFRVRPISTSANFNFGQFRLRPISTSANFWMLNFRTTKGRAPKGGAPKGGGPNQEKVGPRRVEPRRVEPRRVEPRRVEPRRVGGQNFALFFSLLPPQFSFFFSLLGSLCGILVVLEAAGP